MIVKMLCPSSAAYDRLIKLYKYRETGVRAYWIVDPDTRTVETHTLADGKYSTEIYGDTGTSPVSVLNDCHITISDGFLKPEGQ